jgi:hypothetical protein
MTEALQQQPMPRKARAKLNRLLAGKEITPEGMTWLINALDPFHDSPNANVGLPDGLGVRTVKKWIRKQVTIEMGVGLTELAVFFTPLEWLYGHLAATSSSLLAGARGTMEQGVAGAATARVAPGVNCVSLQTGANLFTSAASTNDTTLNLLATDWDTNGGGRVVAMAFEVNDVTPQLTDGGSITMFRIPSSQTIVTGTRSAGGATLHGVPSKTTVGLPGSLAELSNNPDNVTVKAQEGAYVVALMQHPQFCPPKNEEMNEVQLMKNGAGTTGPCFYRNNTAADYFTSTHGSWAIGGAWLSGLTAGGGANPSSKINVVAKYLVEEVCVPTDSVFPFSTPSAPLDPLALEIYTRVLQEMPVGVPVSENPLGEWFNSLMDCVAEYAPKVLSSIPVVGGLVGAGVSAAATAARNINQSLQRNENKTRARGPPPTPPKKPAHLRSKPVQKKNGK